MRQTGFCTVFDIEVKILKYVNILFFLHHMIAKGCPEFISSVGQVSSCSYQNTFWSFIIIWVVELCCYLSCWFLLLFELTQFEFLSFVTIWVFEFWCLLSFRYGHCLSCWVWSQFKLLSCVAFLTLNLVTIWVLSFVTN